MTDAEFMEWWDGCAWHKTGKELDAWPREKMEELKQAQHDIEALASELHWTAAVFDFQDTIGGELLRDYVARMVKKEKLKLEAAREQFVALAVEALNARTALRGLLHYERPDSTVFRCAVKMAKHVLASSIVTLPADPLTDGPAARSHPPLPPGSPPA